MCAAPSLLSILFFVCLFCLFDLRHNLTMYFWLSWNLLQSASWPLTHSNPPASVFRMRRLPVFTTMFNICYLFEEKEKKQDRKPKPRQNVWGGGWLGSPGTPAWQQGPCSHTPQSPAGQLMVSGRKLLQIRLQPPAESLGCLTAQARVPSELDCSCLCK